MTESIIDLNKLLESVCPRQAEIVRSEWPNGIPLTEAAATRAAELHLDVEWAAYQLLLGPALAEFERARDSAVAEYRKRWITASWAEYPLVMAMARAEFKLDVALLLLRILQAQGGVSDD
jgi:hypothetical protein